MSHTSALSASPAQSPATAWAVPLSGKRRPADARPLEPILRSPDHAGREGNRLQRRAMRAEGAKLLRGHDKLGRRAIGLSSCGQVWRADAACVSLVVDRETGRAFFGGVQRCSSVWLCPDCSARISAVRKAEMDLLLAGARAAGLSPMLLTLTVRHGAGDDLPSLLAALKGARDRLTQRREWRALKAQVVTATEVTFGRNGWHPHMHLLVIADGDEASLLAALGALLPVWLACLAAFGLSGNGSALHVQGAASAGAYVAKWGAAEEMTLNTAKSGRDGGQSPWQLLDLAASSDDPAERGRAARLWVEYASAFHGRRQLVWSRGLKARFGVGETSDADAASGDDPAPGESTPPTLEVVRVWTHRDAWKDARRRVVALLRAAESGACLDAAEFGPSDYERWLRERCGPVLEPLAEVA